MSGHVIVIGGGVIGAFSAYFLRRAGFRVTLLEKGAFGSGCSHANCGLVSPSHVLPLAGPGAIRTAFEAIIKPNGPLRIRPRFDPALWNWMLRFALRYNRRAMIDAGHGIQALLNSSRQLYADIIAAEALDCEWTQDGILFVLATHHGMEHFAATNSLLRDVFAMPARRIDGPDLADFEPALKPGFAGAWYYEGDAHLRPDRLMIALRGVLEKQGVAIRENCQVLGLHTEHRRALAVNVAEEEISAEHFLFTTGAWTPLLARQLGVSLPIQPGKGYSITMPRPTLCPRMPLIFEEHRVAVTPMASGYRVGSTMEFAGYDASLNPNRLELLKNGARHYLKEPLSEPIQEEWFGWRPMTPDGKPILDRCPRLANVWLAAGHNMLGLSMAPATGKLMAELIGGNSPHIDPRPYRVGRF